MPGSPLSSLKCKICGDEFVLSRRDADFYKRISPTYAGRSLAIPAPTYCPACRLRRRLSYRNEYVYYPRKCDRCAKDIVSVYAPDAPWPVYCHHCWWGEGWDPRDYGLRYDPGQSFMSQYMALRAVVPQPAMMNDNGVASENCEYCQDFGFGKNCYLVTASWQIEDSLYCTQCNYCRSGLDSLIVSNSELFYECLGCEKLYDGAFLSLCSGCSNCRFGYDLRGCNDCVCCAGLRQQRHCICNKQCSPEEYRRAVAAMRLDTTAGLERAKQQFGEFLLTMPRKAVQQINCENATGDLLFHCRNFEGFGMINAEECRHIWQGDAARHCYDVNNTGKPEWCYEGITPDNSYQSCFTMWCWKDKYVLYSDNCHSCEHLLGCISLRRESHCILNRKYPKDEYERLAAAIIESMQRDGDWGEFFPMAHSPFAYNESRAYDVFPMSEDDARRKGFRWRPESVRAYKPATAAVPHGIKDAEDSITRAVLACSRCARNYRITPQELAFHRKLALPLPTLCPNCRRQRRLSAPHAAGRLYERACAKCGAATAAVYPPAAPEVVYCENCYRGELH